VQGLAFAVGSGDVQSHNPEHVGLAVKAITGCLDLCVYPAEALGQGLFCQWSGADFQQYVDGAGQAVLVGAGNMDEQLLAEWLGQTVFAAIGSADFQTRNPEHAGLAVLLALGSSDVAVFPNEHLGLIAALTLAGEDLKIIPEHHVQVLLAAIGAGDLQTYADADGAALRTWLLGFDVGQFDEHHGQLSRLVCGGRDVRHYNPEYLGLAILTACAGAELQIYIPEHLAQVLAAAHSGLDLQNYVDYAGQALVTALDFWVMQTFPLRLSLPNHTGRRIAWDAPNFPDGTAFLVLADGEVLGETTERTYELRADLEVRQYLQVGHPRSGPVRENALRTPKDRVRLRWSGDAASYQVWRQTDGEDWQQIAETALTEYVDGPRADGTWNYKVVAVDEEGDTAESTIATLTVSSAPEPPAGLSVEVT